MDVRYVRMRWGESREWMRRLYSHPRTPQPPLCHAASVQLYTEVYPIHATRHHLCQSSCAIQCHTANNCTTLDHISPHWSISHYMETHHTGPYHTTESHIAPQRTTPLYDNTYVSHRVHAIHITNNCTAWTRHFFTTSHLFVLQYSLTWSLIAGTT